MNYLYKSKERLSPTGKKALAKGLDCEVQELKLCCTIKNSGEVIRAEERWYYALTDKDEPISPENKRIISSAGLEKITCA